MSTAEKYYASVFYNGLDISQDITSHLVELKYVDQVHGQSDEIEITLEDSEEKWRNEWYPKKGDLLNVTIGPTKDSAFDCGVFWIDEIEGSGPPDVVIIRGLATGGKGKLNTPNSSAHEGKSLKEIANTIAKNNGLTIDNGGFSNTSLTPYNLKSEAKILQVAGKILSSLVPLSDQDVQRGLVRVQQDLSSIHSSLTLKKADKELSEIKQLMQSLISFYAGLDVSDGSSKGKRDVILYKESTFASNLAIKFLAASGITSQTNSKAGALDGIVINRCTQNHESDLGFLKRLCNEYGIVFSVRGTVLFFTTVFKIEDLPSGFTIDRKQLKSYSFKDKLQKVFKKATVKYHNPVDKEVVVGEFANPEKENADGEKYQDETSDDTIVIHTKSETKEQAEIKAQAALHSANGKAKDGSITLDGNEQTVLIMAGNNFDLTGCGVFSSKVHVITSTHTISPSGGYEISADVKTVATVKKEKHKATVIEKTYKPQSAKLQSGFADGVGFGNKGFAY